MHLEQRQRQQQVILKFAPRRPRILLLLVVCWLVIRRRRRSFKFTTFDLSSSAASKLLQMAPPPPPHRSPICGHLMDAIVCVVVPIGDSNGIAPDQILILRRPGSHTEVSRSSIANTTIGSTFGSARLHVRFVCPAAFSHCNRRFGACKLYLARLLVFVQSQQ